MMKLIPKVELYYEDEYWAARVHFVIEEIDYEAPGGDNEDRRILKKGGELFDPFNLEGQGTCRLSEGFDKDTTRATAIKRAFKDLADVEDED